MSIEFGRMGQEKWKFHGDKMVKKRREKAANSRLTDL